MMNDDRFELTVAEKFHSVAPYLELVFEGQNSPDDALGQMVDLLGESYLILDRESGKYILLKSPRIHISIVILMNILSSDCRK